MVEKEARRKRIKSNSNSMRYADLTLLTFVFLSDLRPH